MVDLMSSLVTTFYCDCCDFEQDSSHTWGRREYVLPDGVHISLNWEIGWCQDCDGIAPIESLIEEPWQIDLREAKENIDKYSPAPVRYWWQLHRWIFASAWANRLNDWKSGREFFLAKVFDAEDGLSLLKSRLSPPKCLSCGGLRVTAPLVISGEELDYPVSEPKRTGTLHPICGGQLWMAQYGSRISLVPTVCCYTPEGEFISNEPISSSYNSSHYQKCEVNNARIRFARDKYRVYPEKKAM